MAAEIRSVEEEINPLNFIDPNRDCARKCDVYSRVVGYYTMIKTWNKGKKEEFKDRLEHSVSSVIKFAEETPVSTEETPAPAVPETQVEQAPNGE